jgi:hypothetical protein
MNVRLESVQWPLAFEIALKPAGIIFKEFTERCLQCDSHAKKDSTLKTWLSQYIQVGKNSDKDGD